METVAYLQLTQEFESESKRVQFSGKAIATAVTVVSTAWAGGLLTAAPALASHCCRPRPVSCCRPRPASCCRPRPISCQPSCYYPQAQPYSSYETSYYFEY